VGDNLSAQDSAAGAQSSVHSEAWSAIITAALLRSLRCVSLLSIALTGVAIHALTGHSIGSIAVKLFCLLTIEIGLVGVYLAVRIEFDARLFERLTNADAAQWRAFDTAMTRLGLMPSVKAGRPLAERISGALRMARWHVAVLVAQIAILLFVFS
jgi:hypothetical protein